MSRPLALAALLLFASAVSAAPVPKSVKAPPHPLIGKTWVGKQEGGWNGDGQGNATYEYTFAAGGKFVAYHNGRFYARGTWTADGDAVEWEYNQRYIVYGVTPTDDGSFAGTASNHPGLKWNVTLKPSEAK